MEPVTKQAKILIAEDTPWMLAKYRDEFSKRGYEVVSMLSCAVGEKPDAEDVKQFTDHFSTPEQFAEKLKAHAPDVVLSDFYMPAMNGDELTRVVKRIAPEMPVLVHTSMLDKDSPAIADGARVSAAAMDAGAQAVFAKNNDKPYSKELRLSHVKRVLAEVGIKHAKPSEWVGMPQPCAGR